MTTYYDYLVVEGEVPKELYGAFFRNGPNPQFAPAAITTCSVVTA